MVTNISQIWERLKTSLWFIPGLMSAFGVMLAFVMLEIDRNNEQIWLPGWLSNLNISGDGVRQVIVVTTGSVMTITGVVFSISIVALSLASNQFGPKILRNFLTDNTNKTILGLLVATFLYGLIVLSFFDENQKAYTPLFTVLINVLLTIIAMSGMIYFIHRISTSIQADEIIALIGGDIEKEISQLDKGTDYNCDEELQESWRENSEKCFHYPVRAAENGYVQTINYEGVLLLAQDNDCYLDIDTRAGKFILKGAEIGRVFSTERRDQDICEQILRCITIDRKRTPVQDLEYILDQLVQVTLRALSPGINDSVTAITCIDWISAAITQMGERNFPSAYYKDKSGRVRLKINPFSFQGAVQTGFNPIRQNCRTNEMVFIYLLESLVSLLKVINHPAYRKALMEQLDALCSVVGEKSMPSLDESKLEASIDAYRLEKNRL